MALLQEETSQWAEIWTTGQHRILGSAKLTLFGGAGKCHMNSKPPCGSHFHLSFPTQAKAWSENSGFH